ncbi:MAG: hypothetical protein H5T96_09550 [Tissierellales bacterium]|nr:hypothetical protein [Tissierellales bacterium]
MSIDLNGSDIDTNDITNVYLTLDRSIIVTLIDKREITIRKSEKWKELYERLTGHSTDE